MLLFVARPHIRFPKKKAVLAKISPDRREKMSVNLPESGWTAAVAMIYDVASQDTCANESNDEAIGPDRVAMTEESVTQSANAPLALWFDLSYLERP